MPSPASPSTSHITTSHHHAQPWTEHSVSLTRCEPGSCWAQTPQGLLSLQGSQRQVSTQGPALSTTAQLGIQLALQMMSHFLSHPLPMEIFSWFAFGQNPLQHYSLSIVRDCFLEFLSRRKCVFLRNRCCSLKPNFMWGLTNETKIITLKPEHWGGSPRGEECFLLGGGRQGVVLCAS